MLDGPHTRRSDSKKPTGPRFFILLLLLISPTAETSAFAQAPISVEVAVRHAIDRPDLRAVTESAAALERATANRDTGWPNPTIAMDRESARLGDHGEVEQSVTVTQALEISGQRGLRQRAAEELGRAGRMDADATRQAAASSARRRFWRVVLLQAQHEVARDWFNRLTQASKRVSERRAAGESSTYDVLRVEREVRAARASVERARVEREVSWLELLEVTGPLQAPATWPRASGELLPEDSRSDLNPVSERPDVLAWEARERAAELELSAARRGWIPQVELKAGWRHVDEAQHAGSGLAAGIALSVPLFDRGQRDAAVARAQIARARGMKRLIEERAKRGRAPAQTRARQLILLSRQVRNETDRAASELQTTAEAAWAGGELDLLELLDVHRGRRDDALFVLELEHAARSAREDLRALMLEERP